jgi:hypothetical protein
MSCLSEAPEGRQLLLKDIKKVEERIKDQVPIVAKHAKIAYDVITWEP